MRRWRWWNCSTGLSRRKRPSRLRPKRSPRAGSADQDRPVVVDGGPGRPRYDKVFEPREKPIRVIVGEQFPGVEPETGPAHQRLGHEYRTRIVFRAVDAVGVAGNRIDVRGARELNSQRQQKFGATSAAPVAAYGDRAFPSCNQIDWRPPR